MEINTISFGNISSVDKMKIIFISSYQDTLVGIKSLVGKMEMIIISFDKVSLVVKMHSAIFLVMVLATILWSVTYFGRLNENAYYQLLQKLVCR